MLGYKVFDLCDPLDLCICMDPSHEQLVKETEENVSSVISGAIRISENYNSIDTDNTFTEGLNPGEDGSGSADMAYDPISEDAEDYEAAELDLLGGSFASEDQLDMVDNIEFGG